MAQRESISFYNELTNLLEMENTNAVIGIDLSKIRKQPNQKTKCSTDTNEESS